MCEREPSAQVIIIYQESDIFYFLRALCFKFMCFPFVTNMGDVLIGNCINNKLHFSRKYSRHFSEDIVCSKKRTVFQKCSSGKTVCFEEEIQYNTIQ